MHACMCMQTCITVPSCMYRHTCTTIHVPPCLYRHACTAIYRPSCMYHHACTAICLLPCMHHHMYRHACSTMHVVLCMYRHTCTSMHACTTIHVPPYMHHHAPLCMTMCLNESTAIHVPPGFSLNCFLSAPGGALTLPTGLSLLLQGCPAATLDATRPMGHILLPTLHGSSMHGWIHHSRHACRIQFWSGHGYFFLPLVIFAWIHNVTSNLDPLSYCY